MKKLILTFTATVLLVMITYGNTDSLSTENSFGEKLLKGKFEFHFRSFWMHTENRGILLDYQTLAKGAGLGYYSPAWKGLHFGFSGFFVFQIYQMAYILFLQHSMMEVQQAQHLLNMINII